MSFYSDDKRHRYCGSTDREICEEVQNVRMRLPYNISQSEENTFKSLVNRLEQTREGNDTIGPLWTWIIVIPGRYFCIRYAKVGNDMGGDDYAKLPIKWLSSGYRDENNSFLHRICRNNIYI